MLTGDLTRFSPGDLVSFLTHLNQEGVLTVSRAAEVSTDTPSEVLNLSFHEGQLTGADSERADAKVLGALLSAGLVDTDRYAALGLARRDTGLPLSQILEACEAVDPAAARDCFELGVREVVFQLFTWEKGEFRFTEIPVQKCIDGCSFDATGLSMDAARQVDEYREFLAGLEAADPSLVLTETGRDAEATPPDVRFVLEAAADGRALHEALAAIPLTSYAALEAVKQAVANGWVDLNSVHAYEPAPQDGSQDGNQRGVCGETLQRMRAAVDRKQQVSELLAYCRERFSAFLLIAFRGDHVVRCRRFRPQEAGGQQGVEIKNPRGAATDDPAFRFVCESGTPFFGATAFSPLLAGLGEPPRDGECAVVPLGHKGDENFLLYVPADEQAETLDALHGLEFLCRQIQPREVDGSDANTPQAAEREKIPSASADTMVEAVNELPSMPHLVSKVLQMLSDPDSQVSDLVQVLARDPSLVARLIRVSNSALYGRGRETTTLDQAVVRLGANTVRSLVTAASMRSLFPLEKTNVGIWGQSLWQHSIECGLAARRVAQLVRYPDPEEAFVAGVLHDIGKVVILLSRPEDYGAILREQTAAGSSYAAAERNVLGFDHTQVGDLLLQKWQMPENLRACALCHHEPSGAGKDELLAHIVALGNTLSHGYGSQADGVLAEVSNDFEASLAALGLGFDQIQTLEAEMGEVLEHSEMLV